MKNTQAKLAQYFPLEVASHSAADLLGIQPNSAALYYRKLRELIAYHLDAQAEELLDGEIGIGRKLFRRSSQSYEAMSAIRLSE